MGDFLILHEPLHGEHRLTRYKQTNLKASLDPVGREWGCSVHKEGGFQLSLSAGPRGDGAGLPALLPAATQHGSLGTDWGVSLAARGRHGNLSLMSYLGVLIVDWKWQGTQGWTACTKVTRQPSKLHCSLECSWPASCPSHFPASLGSLLRWRFLREAILSSLFETSSPLQSLS